MLKVLIAVTLFVTIAGFILAGAKALWIFAAFLIAYWGIFRPLFDFSIDTDWRD